MTDGDATARVPAPATRDWERSTFGERAARTIVALAEALLDDGEGTDLSGRMRWLVVELDRVVSNTSWRVRLAFRATLLVIEWLPLVLSLRPARFRDRSVRERVELLERLDRHAWLAVVLVPWKTLLALVYYEHAAALAETGYDGTCAKGAP